MSTDRPRSKREAAVLATILAGAFAVRVAVRLNAGRSSLAHGYDVFLLMAEHVAAGHGLCVDITDCAARVPVYPLILAPFVAAGTVFPAAVLLQAALGAVVVWATSDIARRIAGASAGLLAGLLAAVSPYAVVHDTALQDTVVANACLAGAIVALFRWRQRPTPLRSGVAGALLGLMVLTSARMAIVALASAVWGAIEGARRGRDWRRPVVAFLFAFLIAPAGWLTRNAMVVGAPVLTTVSGASLWFANSEWTFRYFPEQSIDRAAVDAIRSLREPGHEAFWDVARDPVASDRYLARLAFTYIAAHPAETISGACRKIWVVLSARLSPSHGAAVDLAYRLLYGAVHLLAIVGIWQIGVRDPRARLLLAILGAFLLNTAVFWAHTSHASTIDAVLFVYASVPLARRGEAGAEPDTSSSITRSK